MATVELTCIKCGKVTEVSGEDFFDMKKRGLILNPSYRGKGKQIDCCGSTKKAPSRGKKKSKAKTPTKAKEPLTTRPIGTKKNPTKAKKSMPCKKLSKKEKDFLEEFVKTEQFLIDGYVGHGFIITEKKDYMQTPIKGYSYKFTANTDAGVPVMDVYQNENEDVREVMLPEETVNIKCESCGRTWKAPTTLLEALMDEGIVTRVKPRTYVGQDYQCRRDTLEKKYPLKGKYPYTKKQIANSWPVKEKLPDYCGRYFAPAIVGLLSLDFEKFNGDPHCKDCTNPDCEKAGVSGDDACASGFRSGL